MRTTTVPPVLAEYKKEPAQRGAGEKDRNLAGKDVLEEKKYDFAGSVLSQVLCCKHHFFLQPNKRLTAGSSFTTCTHQTQWSRPHRRQPMGGPISGRTAAAASYPPSQGVCYPVVASPATTKLYLSLHMWRLAGQLHKTLASEVVSEVFRCAFTLKEERVRLQLLSPTANIRQEFEGEDLSNKNSR